MSGCRPHIQPARDADDRKPSGSHALAAVICGRAMGYRAQGRQPVPVHEEVPGEELRALLLLPFHISAVWIISIKRSIRSMSWAFSRRQFIASSAAFIGASYFPCGWSKTTPSRLPIPPLVDGRKGRPIELQIRSGTWSFKSGVKTPTLGFSQDYLGPTIRTRQYSELNLHYQNTLTESVAVHGHGLHVPGEVDGGPQLAIDPDADWQLGLSIVQPAATCWYHSHTHGKTGEQTYRGLAGLIIIDDEQVDSLPLPHRYGVDDLPVIIQDRTFDAQGAWSIHCTTQTRTAGWVTL